MDISSITISIPRPSPSISISSAHSTFVTNTSFFSNAKAKFESLVINRTRTRIRTERTRKAFTCNALFGLGVPELVVIAGVAALVFGPKKLPEVGKSIGKTVKSFQQAAKEFEAELKKEPDSTSESSLEKPTTVSEDDKEETKVSSSKENV